MSGFFLAQPLKFLDHNMPAIQSIMGSISSVTGGGSGVLPDPGGWFSSVPNQPNESALRYKLYDQYHNESTNVSAMTLLQDDYVGYPSLYAGDNSRTYMFTGYFYVATAGDYMFRTISDDGSYLWIGTYAWNTNFTINNALINNGGLHGPATVDSAPISLVGNQWYPIRILFGNLDGGTELQVLYKTVADANWTNQITWANNTATAEGFN
jgi:hypothetical protein